MNPTPPPPGTPESSAWQRTSTAGLIRWFFSRRVLGRIVIGIVWIATLIALLYGVENWRGRRAWARYVQSAQPSRQAFDYQTYLPPPVPDAQNFAATPFVQQWFIQDVKVDDLWDTNYVAAVRRLDSKRDKTIRQPVDLTAYGSAFTAVRAGTALAPAATNELSRAARAQAATTVLAALKNDEAAFAELRSASQRSEARYPVVYDLNNPWGVRVPHLAHIKTAVSRLLLKASAELALNRTEAAHADVNLIWYLGESLKSDPFTISHLVRMACARIGSDAVWEGLAARAWSAQQLEQLQSNFQAIDFVTDTKNAFARECAAGVLTVDLLYHRKYQISQLFEVPSPDLVDYVGPWLGGVPLFEVIAHAAPRGWYYQEQVNVCRRFDTLVDRLVDTRNRRIIPRPSDPDTVSALAELSRRREETRKFGGMLREFLRHELVAIMLLPEVLNVAHPAAVAQCSVDQAVLGCALERYRLAVGDYPPNLESLVPRFSPAPLTDVITGQPYRYRRLANDQFVLYSVGPNSKDDGGIPGATLFDQTQGDWIWTYPQELPR